MEATLKNLKDILDGVQKILDKLYPQTAKLDAPDGQKSAQEAIQMMVNVENSTQKATEEQIAKEAKEEQIATEAKEEQIAKEELDRLLTQCDADNLSDYQKLACKKLKKQLAQQKLSEILKKNGGAVQKKNSVKRSRKFVRKQRAATKQQVLFRFSNSNRKATKKLKQTRNKNS